MRHRSINDKQQGFSGHIQLVVRETTRSRLSHKRCHGNTSVSLGMRFRKVSLSLGFSTTEQICVLKNRDASKTNYVNRNYENAVQIEKRDSESNNMRKPRIQMRFSSFLSLREIIKRNCVLLQKYLSEYKNVNFSFE